MAIQWQEVPQKNVRSPANPPPLSRTGNPWFAVSVGLIALMVGFAAGTWRNGGSPVAVGTPPDQVVQAPTPTPTQEPPPEPTSAQNLPPIDAKTDHIRGNLAKAKVAVVEYSDFECPFCKRHHPTMQQIMDTYKDDVVWVYRHYPLPFHPNAQKAAEASECANELGGNEKFWEMTDGIFALDALSTEGFIQIAKDIGLNEAKFTSCLDSGKFKQLVQDQMAGGSAAGVNGTPGNIIVNLKTDENRIVSGAQPFSAFKAAIDALLGAGA